MRVQTASTKRTDRSAMSALKRRSRSCSDQTAAAAPDAGTSPDLTQTPQVSGRVWESARDLEKWVSPFVCCDGLKKMMVGDLELFSRNLCIKLLTCATGRTMNAADLPHIDRMVSRVRKQGSGLKGLVPQDVSSGIS